MTDLRCPNEECKVQTSWQRDISGSIKAFNKQARVRHLYFYVVQYTGALVRITFVRLSGGQIMLPLQECHVPACNQEAANGFPGNTSVYVEHQRKWSFKKIEITDIN